MILEFVKNQFPETALEIERLETLGFHQRTLSWLLALDEETAQTACWLMGKVGNDDDADAMVSILSSQRSELWMYAATALSLIATERHLTSLLSILSSSPHANQKESAAYALSFLTKCQVNSQVIDILTQVAANNSENPSVRAQALEGLGNKLSEELPQDLYQRAVTVMIQCLDDAEAEVRFWACFAVGAIRAKDALPKLQVLAQTDDAIVPLWWSVGKEAEDAIALINGDEPPLGKPL
ncbi:HEAT repeat domain-containing protein [Calothrix membranacea FACHB-236]|nr:HEAT repeat domain-containing protein [Calothrix membranacea FACHB-236]